MERASTLSEATAHRNNPADTESISAKAAEYGEALFLKGLYCAESVLKTAADFHGVEDPFIPGIATGFCGGVSRTSGMCGALAGGIMAIGLLAGRSGPADDKNLCYTLVHHLVTRFRDIFGSTQCSDLLGCDISTAEGARIFSTSDLEISVCARLTSRTAALVEEIFLERDTLRHPLL